MTHHIIQPELGTLVLDFVEDILGFDNIKTFRLSAVGDGIPFFYLKAEKMESPCFIVCDPYYFVPDYALDYDSDIMKDLSCSNPDDLRCVAISKIPDKFENATANLKSPIIFNLENSFAKQFVIDNLEYPIRYKLFEKIPTVK